MAGARTLPLASSPGRLDLAAGPPGDQVWFTRSLFSPEREAKRLEFGWRGCMGSVVIVVMQHLGRSAGLADTR